METRKAPGDSFNVLADLTLHIGIKLSGLTDSITQLCQRHVNFCRAHGGFRVDLHRGPF